MGGKHLPADGADWSRLAELAGALNAGARVSVAPLFAAWRSMPEPAGDAQALALHRMNVTRELRFSMHAAVVIAAGLTPLEAMAASSPFMIPMFGWTTEAPEDIDELKSRWDAAEAGTNRALAYACARAARDRPRRAGVAVERRPRVCLVAPTTRQPCRFRVGR